MLTLATVTCSSEVLKELGCTRAFEQPSKTPGPSNAILHVLTGITPQLHYIQFVQNCTRPFLQLFRPSHFGAAVGGAKSVLWSSENGILCSQ